MRTTGYKWGEFVSRLMGTLQISQREMAIRLSAKLGSTIHQGSVQSRIAGKYGLPPDDEKELNAWADVLKLEGYYREEFLRLAWIEHTPKKIQDLIKDLQEQEEKNRRTEKALIKQVEELTASRAKLALDLAKATQEAARLLAHIQK